MKISSDMDLLDCYLDTRKNFVKLCKPLQTEDYVVQPADFVSPPKWHLAHTTWFFEQFVLMAYADNYKVYNDDYSYLFNSYYNNAGDRVLRPHRGLMTRPTVDEVYGYRDYVDREMEGFLNDNPPKEARGIVELGIHHEQQHQELFYYDIKYILGHQPTFPSIENDLELENIAEDEKFITIDEGLYQIGFADDGFCYDNEQGVHKVYLPEYKISNRLVSNGEFIEFIEAGGYGDFNLWHAEGWDFINNNGIAAPLYWHKHKGQWHYYTLDGFRPVELDRPVNHISHYEAFAYAEWKGTRLPTEFEWEAAADKLSWGQLWEHTQSAYLPYPGFTKAPGALGEYNGKFMVNQKVFRGASVATCKGHSRKTYRNFFHPNMRWHFCGIRLVK